MRRLAKIFGIIVVVLAVMAALATWQRHRLAFALASSGEQPELLTEFAEIPGGEWADDYYVVVALDAQTFAIAEPRYPQRNFNYLILGTERAILFDAGAGHFDIRPVVETLTDLPVTFIPSHFHFDHIGNTVTFDHVAVVDLPHIRAQAADNRLALTWEQHLGSFEGIAAPTLEIDEWLAVNSTLDLGDRQLKILFTPGHTDDSISLLDLASADLFSGDFLYPGELYAFMPNSRMGDYLGATETVLSQVPSDARLLGAHGVETGALPALAMGDVADLQEQLQRIRDGELSGEGLFPHVYVINDNLQLLAEPPWLQDWSQRYP
jgi:glyoxylase-like metal-dependent hydrolase (beta-lactamase superfamily II)